MMDRNREARRGATAAVNGAGPSRRRQQRTTNLRDSPEEDGAMEMQQEPSRLRDRGTKKDRDRDRDRERSSSRNKRRKGERSMHSNREDGDDSSEESIDEDDDEEQDESVTVRLPLAAAAAISGQIPSSLSSIQQLNHHHVAKKGSFSANNNKQPVRPPAPSWKVAEEMIGVSIPRKARSSSLKRSQECGDTIQRQASTSPARPSPSSTTAVSPSSSNASVRRKKLSGGTKQHRPPKIAKSPSAASSIQEIEIEVAEVLYGMTRQAPPLVNKQENSKVDSKDTEAKSNVCSPNSISQQQSTLPPSSSPPMITTAPKRKRPRLKFDEERPASPSTKMETEIPTKADEVSSPKSEKNSLASPALENGLGSCDRSDAQHDSAKPGSCNHVLDSSVTMDGGEEGVKKEDVAVLSSKAMETSCVGSSINNEEAAAAANVLREEKLSIDLMAPPPLPDKSSDKDGLLEFVSDHKSLGPEKTMFPDSDIAIGEAKKVEKDTKQEVTSEHAGNFLAQEFESKKEASTDKIPDVQLDLGNHDKDSLSLSCSSKQQQQVPKQQQKSARIDPKEEKSAPLTSMPLPMAIAGWPGGFPSFGYMSQVPSLQAVVPMDGSLGTAKSVQQPPPHFLQPQMRPKRCATHCYIAQNIHYHQQIARMGPFWPAAAAAAAVNVAKQYNLNAVPPPDSAAILGNPLHGGFPPPRSAGPMQDKSTPSVATAGTGPSTKEKSTAPAALASDSNTFMEAAQRKQFLLPQSLQTGSSVAAPPSMIHGPAFIFPINQHTMVNRSGAPSKSTPIGNAAPSASTASSAAAGSGAAGHSATTMSFNYAGLSPDAQYMTILQNNTILPNNAYPFPIAAAHVGGPASFRGTVPAQAMPFFNGPYYSSQMVPSQQQQQLMQQQQQQQQGHQNPSTSSGSSSSQKHAQQSHQQQQQRVPGGLNSHCFPTSKQPLHLLPHQARQLDSEAACEDSPSTADSSRASQAQKGIYTQNFVPMHSQNFALISPTSTTGGGHGENRQQSVAVHPHQAMKVDLTPSQAYAVSFASFGGSAATAAPPSLDFSAMVQNPAMLQNLPEVARQGYHPFTMAAAAAATQVATAQHKKSHHEDGKSVGETTTASANVAADDGKTAAAAAKSVAQQHSLSFSRPDNDPTPSSIVSNHADVSSRALNLLHPPVNGAQMSNPPSTAPASAATTNSPSSQHLPLSQSKQQYYQQVMQLQHQQRILFLQQQQQQQHQQSPQQQQMQLLQQQQQQISTRQQQSQQQQQLQLLQQQQQQQQQQMSSRQQMMSRAAKSSTAHNGSSSSNISSSTMSARYTQGGLSGFPPSLIQGSSGSASQSPQWKTSSTNRAAAPAPASSATSSSSSAKNQIPQHQQQQQQKQQQQPLISHNTHHTQISFGISTSSNKPSISSSAAAAGSPQNSASKSSTTAAAAAGGGSNGGSPRASLTSKLVQPPVSVLPTLPLQQQQAAVKNSPSAAVSSLKPSSPITNNNNNNSRSMTTSILGHPHITPSNSSSSKKLQQQSQQKQQPFQQPQFFFNNPYIQAQASARRQADQPNSATTTSGMMSLSPASLTLAGGANVTSDPTKAAASTNNIKGLTTQQQQQAGILQHNSQYAAATSMASNHYPGAFNYLQVLSPSSVSVKPASSAAMVEQKQSAPTGNENAHACWKPEKR